MGSWVGTNVRVVPRLVNVTCANRRMEPLRQRALAGAAGTVVELGFGSGANLRAYPSEVDRVIAIDPSIVGRKLAAKRMAASRIPVDFAGLDGEQLAARRRQRRQRRQHLDAVHDPRCDRRRARSPASVAAGRPPLLSRTRLVAGSEGRPSTASVRPAAGPASPAVAISTGTSRTSSKRPASRSRTARPSTSRGPNR